MDSLHHAKGEENPTVVQRSCPELAIALSGSTLRADDRLLAAAAATLRSCSLSGMDVEIYLPCSSIILLIWGL